jgi:outer membrane protein
MNGQATMRSFLTRSTTVIFLSFTLAGMAAAQESSVGITLKEAIRSAAEKNFDVKAELYNPAQAESDIRKYRGIYDPNLTAQISYGENTSANLGTISTFKSFDLATGINQLTPWGGTVSVGMDNGWSRTEYNALVNGRQPSEYFLNSLTVSVKQPLLKSFGRESTELNISLASYSKEAYQYQFLTQLTSIITRVRTEYFKLYYLRENLEVNRTSLTLAQKILAETKAKVKAGVLPAMEILNAEFNVSTRENSLIIAEQALRDERDLLRTLCQITEPGEIDPVDSPVTAPVPLTETEAVKSALSSRPELKQLRETIKSAELQERFSRQQTLPDLSLSASAGLQGIDSSYGTQWESLGRGDYPVWNVGLSFAYPLGNTAAKNDAIRSRLKTEQLRLQTRSQEESIANEVRSAIRAVQSGYKQLDVTSRGSAYAEEVLNAYVKKAAVGLATTKDVFDVQNNLVAAKGAEIQARAGYDNALTQYWKATGAILQQEGIKINGKEADALIGKMN